MVFKRKNKKTWLQWVKDAFWPSIGFRRSLKYLKLRLIRLPHSDRDIAAGLAFGCAISWTPTWGLQLVQCFIFAKLVRANFLAALIGSAFGNPWTFPLLIFISYSVGDTFLTLTNLYEFFEWRGVSDIALEQKSLSFQAFIPTLIGGYMMAILTFPLFYYPFYYMIGAARKAQAEAKKKVAALKDLKGKIKK